MDWGVVYWLVVPSEEKLRYPERLTCEPVGSVDVWQVYEVTLPTPEIARGLNDHQIGDLETWLEHPIRFPRAQAWVIRPYPIAEEADIWVFPPTESVEISIRGEADGEPAVVASSGREWKKAMGVSSWILADLIPDFYTIYIGLQAAFVFRISHSVPRIIAPEGINVATELGVWPLLNCQRTLTAFRESRVRLNSLRLIIPDSLPQSTVDVNGFPWRGEDLREAFNDRTKAFEVNSRSYGRVFIPGDQQQPVEHVPEAVLAKAEWLLSIPSSPRFRESIGFPRTSNLSGGLIDRLMTKRWAPIYAPQVYWLWNQLKQ